MCILGILNKCYKVKFSYDYDLKKIKKGPTILLASHASRLEFIYMIYGFKHNDINIVCGYQNIIKKGLQSFLTKSIDWAYEKEVRCLFLMKSSDQFTSIGEGKYLYIMPTSITEIYLGCKIDKDNKDNKENITRIAKEKNIKVYQYLASSDKYELIVE